MATSTLRAAIIVAALVLGGIVLANAFPGTVIQGPTGGPGGPTTVPPTTPTTTAPTVPPAEIQGAVLQVLNGTSTSGLAGEVATCLVEQGGAVIPPETNIANAPENYAETTLLHRGAAANALAQALRTRFFPGAKIQRAEPLPENPDVQVTVIVGADYTPVAECG